MSKLGMPRSVLSSLHFPTTVMWCFFLHLTFSDLFSCPPTPTPSFLCLWSLFFLPLLDCLVNSQKKISWFGLAIKEATLWNSDASWMFFCGFRDVCDSKRVTRDEEKKKYRTTSLCFHSPYHGLWVLGFFSKRLATFLFNSRQRAKKWP